MKNRDLKKKKKFKNAYQYKRNTSKHAKKLSFHFFHIYKKWCRREIRTNTNFDNTVYNELTLYQLS